MTAYRVQKSDAEWREQLTPQEYAVLRQAGTERPFTGEYVDTKTEGVIAAAPAVSSCSGPTPSSTRIAAGPRSTTPLIPTPSSC